MYNQDKKENTPKPQYSSELPITTEIAKTPPIFHSLKYKRQYLVSLSLHN